MRPPADPHWKRALSQHDRQDLLTQYRQLPFRCAEPAIVAKKPGDPVRTATCFLVTFDRAHTLLLTCSHVLNFYLKCREDSETAYFCVGENTAFDPLPRVITNDSKRDVAVLNVTDLALYRTPWPLPDLQPFIADPWPPQELNHNAALVFGGYPEKFRGQDGRLLKHVGMPFIGLLVDDVSDHFFTIHFEREQYTAEDGSTDHPELSLRDFSGLSGSPIFRIVTRPVERPELVGMVSEHLDLSEDAEVLKCASLRDMSTDGAFPT